MFKGKYVINRDYYLNQNIQWMLMLFFSHLNIKIKPRPCSLEVKTRTICWTTYSTSILIDFFAYIFMGKSDGISSPLLRSVLGMRSLQSHIHLGLKKRKHPERELIYNDLSWPLLMKKAPIFFINKRFLAQKSTILQQLGGRLVNNNLFKN